MTPSTENWEELSRIRSDVLNGKSGSVVLEIPGGGALYVVFGPGIPVAWTVVD